MKTLLALIMLILPVINAHASDTAKDVTSAVTNNIAEEFVACASYYSIASAALEKSGKKGLSEEYERLMYRMVDYSLMASKEGRTQEMAYKVTMARLELHMKDMIKEIDNNYSNISILLNKYAHRCKEITEKPEAMMKDVADKTINKMQ